MALQTLTFKKYKAFQAAQEISLRPLTLIIGRNNSGKSALTRLPLLLGSGFSSKADGLFDLKAGGVDFGSFMDLTHGRNPHGSFNLGGCISKNGTSFKFEYQFRHLADLKSMIVMAFNLAKNDEPGLTMEWCGDDDNPLQRPAPFMINGDKGNLCRLSFEGLLFELEGEGPLVLKEFVVAARDHLNHIHYKGPFRDVPSRYFNHPEGRGRNAFELLANDKIREKGQLLRDVSNWFKDNMGGWELDLEISGFQFSIVLKHPEHTGNLPINIVDTGAGIAQILPLVVQRFIKEELLGKSGLLEIVEQPELHLHPAAHGAIADLYIHASKQESSQFLIETHSEVFLLRTQYHVATGLLRPEDVIIYWVDDKRDMPKIRAITIDERGELSDWPQGVFSEDFDEVKRLRLAQRGRV